jgi:hypothetical protein
MIWGVLSAARGRAPVGLKLARNSNPEVHSVESTSSNYVIENSLRVTDCKHGFESRWGAAVVEVLSVVPPSSLIPHIWSSWLRC